MRILGPVLACLLTTGAMAQAQEAAGPYYRGQQLHRHCFSEDTIAQGICYGYIVAVADAAISGLAIEGQRACIPADASTGRLRNAVKAYLEGRPERLEGTGIALVAAALAEAFPCGA